MASYITLDSAKEWLNKCIIEHGYTGKFYAEYLPWRDCWGTIFHVEYKYLKVCDRQDRDSEFFRHITVPKESLQTLFNELREIHKQIQYYFNAIWC